MSKISDYGLQTLQVRLARQVVELLEEYHGTAVARLGGRAPASHLAEVEADEAACKRVVGLLRAAEEALRCP